MHNLTELATSRATDGEVAYRDVALSTELKIPHGQNFKLKLKTAVAENLLDCPGSGVPVSD